MINLKKISENTEMGLEKFVSKPIFVILIISIISLGLRLFFTRFDYPLESQDAFHHLVFAFQISDGNFERQSPMMGWPFVLAIFISPFSSEEILDFMNIVRIVSITISVITIPIVYKLAKNFVDNRFALLASSFFAFDPNLIENSIFGITESLFILIGLLAIYFGLRDGYKFLIISAFFAGLAIDVRLNGIVLFIIGIIICFSKGIDNKEKFKRTLLFLLIFAIAASPYYVQNYIVYGNPFAQYFGFARAVDTQVAPSIEASKLDNSLIVKLSDAVTEEFKHIFRISVPYLALFVPFGIFVALRNLDINKKIIFSCIIISLIIAIPQYTLSIEYRNLFFILPFFAIISCIGIHQILQKNETKNIFLVLLVGGIILLSYNMMRERSGIDLELLNEKEVFGKYVANSYNGKIMGDMYTQIAHHLKSPKLGIEIDLHNDNLTLIGFGPPLKTMNDVIEFSKSNGITHLVIDNQYESRSPEFVNAYYNEENYPYLEKIFDSNDRGYKKLKVKIFKINYDVFK